MYVYVCHFNVLLSNLQRTLLQIYCKVECVVQLIINNLNTKQNFLSGIAHHKGHKRHCSWQPKGNVFMIDTNINLLIYLVTLLFTL